MKQKKVSKKLVLNKSTVSDLSSTAMNHIKGGLETSDPRICYTWEDGCSDYQSVYYTCPRGCKPCIRP
jgi:natural product precursor